MNSKNIFIICAQQNETMHATVNRCTFWETLIQYANSLLLFVQAYLNIKIANKFNETFLNVEFKT